MQLNLLWRGSSILNTFYNISSKDLNLQHIARELEQLQSQFQVISNALSCRLLAVAHIIPTNVMQVLRECRIDDRSWSFVWSLAHVLPPPHPLLGQVLNDLRVHYSRMHRKNLHLPVSAIKHPLQFPGHYHLTQLGVHVGCHWIITGTEANAVFNYYNLID